MSPADIRNSGLRRRSRQASDQRLLGLPAPFSGFFSLESSAPELPSFFAPPPAPSPAPDFCWPTGAVVAVFSSSCIANPRVKHRVEQVDDQVGDQVDQD